MSKPSSLSRAQQFCERHNLQLPILMAPMAGACPPALAAAVCNAGGMGACGALLLQPDGIVDWASELRSATNGSFQMNLWIPDPPPDRDQRAEDELREFLGEWGPAVPADAAEMSVPDFNRQCDAILEAKPGAVSSIMGLYDETFVDRLKAEEIPWFATVTTVAEARAAEAAGADVIVAQGMEAGGHRGAFNEADAEQSLVGLFSLLPAVVDAVDLPVVATGGIADARGVAAALVLGASAVQMGTALLRTPEADVAPAWADAIGRTMPEDTIATRAFSGRLGRSVRTAYAQAAEASDSPNPAPYPVQRAMTGPMRNQGLIDGDINRMQAWAGQSAHLARSDPAAVTVTEIWEQSLDLLGR